jgi:DNA-binding transcriptional MerR regulator
LPNAPMRNILNPTLCGCGRVSPRLRLALWAKHMDSRFPEKLFYRIGDVSEITGIKPHVLRYWESEFSGLHPRKNHAGQRVYERRDVELVLEIKKLLYEQRYTISGAKKLLARRNKPALKKPTPAKRPADISEALKLCSQELRGLLALLKQDGPGLQQNGGQSPHLPQR